MYAIIGLASHRHCSYVSTHVFQKFKIWKYKKMKYKCVDGDVPCERKSVLHYVLINTRRSSDMPGIAVVTIFDFQNVQGACSRTLLHWHCLHIYVCLAKPQQILKCIIYLDEVQFFIIFSQFYFVAFISAFHCTWLHYMSIYFIITLYTW